MTSQIRWSGVPVDAESVQFRRFQQTTGVFSYQDQVQPGKRNHEEYQQRRIDRPDQDAALLQRLLDGRQFLRGKAPLLVEGRGLGDAGSDPGADHAVQVDPAPEAIGRCRDDHQDCDSGHGAGDAPRPSLTPAKKLRQQQREEAGLEQVEEGDGRVGQRQKRHSNQDYRQAAGPSLLQAIEQRREGGNDPGRRSDQGEDGVGQKEQQGRRTPLDDVTEGLPVSRSHVRDRYWETCADAIGSRAMLRARLIASEISRW